jgi:ketosteroid isomerase-like protein
VGLSETDLEMMRSGYSLWNEGDIDGVVDRCLAKDIEFHLGSEWPGLDSRYYGADEVARFLREDIAKVIGLRDIQIEREEIFEETVIFALRTVVEGELSGVTLGEVPIFHVVRVADGRVVRIEVFLDEQKARSAAAKPSSS